MKEHLGFDVPGLPDEQDDAQTDEQAGATSPGLVSPVVAGAAKPALPQAVVASGEAASELPPSEEPLPDNLGDAVEELTRLDNLSVTGKAERLRSRRRDAVAKIAFDLQNGPPAPGPITADEQAEQRNGDPFAAAEQRLAELAAKHPELAGKV